jgi:membrane protease YdiL (CAAX protease family)
VSQPDETTPAQWAALSFEVALLLVGIGILVWLLVSPKGKATRASRLPAWRMPPLDFLVLLCFGFVGSTFTSAVAGFVIHHVALSTDALTVVSSAVMEGGFLLGLAVFYLMHAGIAPVGPRPALRHALKGGAATFLVSTPFVAATLVTWGFFLTRMGLPDEKQELVSILENDHSAVLRASFAVVALVLVPVTEEVLFRGCLFRFLLERIPRWAAISSSSLLFGALHVQWWDHMGGLPSFLPLVVLAAIFCVAYERTGTLAAPIIAHALFNLNTFVLVLTGIS